MFSKEMEWLYFSTMMSIVRLKLIKLVLNGKIDAKFHIKTSRHY